VQASLQARLRGDLSGVDKNILNADKVSLFGPYWPIKCTVRGYQAEGQAFMI
jgi:hypothetical protein